MRGLTVITPFVGALLLLWAGAVAAGSQVDDWLSALDKPHKGFGQLRQENLKGKYGSHDISSLLVPRSQFLGYVGGNYRRLYIQFNNVHRDGAAPEIYLVSGVTRVHGGPVEDFGTAFRGTITVLQIREFTNFHYGGDDLYKEMHPQAEGVLVARYRFEEDRNHPSSGVFEGVVTVGWLLDRFGVLQYDDIDLGSRDSYSNNQYVGTWTSSKGGSPIAANWGEYRIPCSGDLDMGAGEFGPNQKYGDMGWQTTTCK